MDRLTLGHGDGADGNAVVSRTVASLAGGGVAAVPTETVYGLVTLWGNRPGRERIYALKRRPAEKHLQMLAADLADAERAGLVSDDRIRRLAERCWPGPLTVVGRARGGGTVGVRVPAHAFVLELVRRLGEPLAATSANLSGRPPAATADAAVAELAGEPDVVVDGGAIDEGRASTVVSLAEAAEVELLRAGPYSLAFLRRVVGG